MKKIIVFVLSVLMLFCLGCTDTDTPNSEGDAFCYSQLSAKEKKAYDSINLGVQSMQTKIEDGLGSLDVEAFDRVYQGVIADHPEYFWLGDSYTYYSGSVIGEGKVSAVEPEYTVSQAELESKKAEFDSAVNSLVAKCSSYSDGYQKAVILHDAIVSSVNYVDDGNSLNSTAYGAIVKRKAVCAGYAKAYKYLLNQAGVECEYVTGKLSDGVGHAWNVLSIGGESFWVDITLDDPVFLGANNSGVNVFYNYFGLTDSQMDSTHDLSQYYDCPECDNEEYDYYKRNGLLLSGADVSGAEKIIKSAYSSGKAVATMKFSDMGSLESVKNSIFNGNRIFDIIGSRTSISYSVDSNNCLLMVKLR